MPRVRSRRAPLLAALAGVALLSLSCAAAGSRTTVAPPPAPVSAPPAPAVPAAPPLPAAAAAIPSTLPAAAPAPTPLGTAGPVSLPLHLRLGRPGEQLDFPALALDGRGTPWVAYVRWDGVQDTLELARVDGGGLVPVTPLGKPGVIHGPTVAVDGKGGVVSAWSQRDERGLMNLLAQRVADGAAAGEAVTLARSEGGNIFPSAATDRAGRVWVAWQSQRGGLPEIFCRVFDPATGAWGNEVRVTDDPAGDWEPRVVPDEHGGAWVFYDSRRGGAFAIWATHVGRKGKLGKARAVVPGGGHEARVAAAAEPGTGAVWLSFERGRAGWGEAQRGRDPRGGLNAGKDAVLGRWDPASGVFEEAPSIVPLLGTLLPRGRVKRTAVAPEDPEDAEDDADPGVHNDEPDAGESAGGSATLRPVRAVNLPQVFPDAAGRPWVAVRFFSSSAWKIALSRYDRASRSWTAPALLPDGSYSQDRSLRGAAAGDGALWLAWPSDARTGKRAGSAEVHVARLEPAAPAALVSPPPLPAAPAPAPYLRPPTPPVAAGARHTWTVGGATYTLLWGDLHRHSDLSFCYQPDDGSIVEQYRYALDPAGLDFLALTDHVDSPKVLTPYEWWQEQTYADLFQTTGSFLTLYGYERKQNWPLGHRNVVFAERDGPLIYRHRALYRASRWQKLCPAEEAGPPEIQPVELWAMLRAWGRPVATIPHTISTSSGVNWMKEPRGKEGVESVAEIYQGARISYEAPGAPQPAVGLRQGDRAAPGGSAEPVAPAAGNPLAGFRPEGSWQEALRRGHRIGVIAGSDHLSERTSYGGFYVKEVSRAGILEAIAARRTFAASDKVVVDFSGDGHPLGEAYTTSRAPRLAIGIAGTAPLRRVTLLRNEENRRVWEPGGTRLAEEFVDETPLPGENRYYLRIEQEDGTMAWSTALWVTVEPGTPGR